MSNVKEISDQVWEDYVQTLPPAIQEVARAFPGIHEGKVCCYRSRRFPHCHYAILGYEMPLDYPGARPTLLVVQGGDSALPGIVSNMVPLDAIELCACGKWSEPTEKQRERSVARVAELRRSAGSN